MNLLQKTIHDLSSPCLWIIVAISHVFYLTAGTYMFFCFSNLSRRKVRILYLRAKLEYLTEMSRWWYHSFNAAQNHPAVEAFQWGIGWEGYNESLTLRQNLEARWGSVSYIDLLLYFHYYRTPPQMAAQIKEVSEMGQTGKENIYLLLIQLQLWFTETTKALIYDRHSQYLHTSQILSRSLIHMKS